MRRPIPWFYWLLLLVCVSLIVVEYLALTWFAPHYVVRQVERAAGGTLTVGEAHLSFPFNTTLTGLRLAHGTPQSTASIQGVIIKPRWLSLPSKTLWVDLLKIEQPLLRLTRTKNGTILWPLLPVPTDVGNTPSDAAPPSLVTPAASPWHMHVQSLQIEEGAIELIDELPGIPFHGVLHHVSLIVGPLVVPFDDTQTSFAFRAEFIGHAGEAAPLYCSGWIRFTKGDLQASCQLEPLSLSALEPYFQGAGRVQVRVYDATLASTSQWSAKSNDFIGRLQFELGNLTEGDLSVRGRTLVDVKKLAGEQPRLSAELKIAGPLDDPVAWRTEFVPGDIVAQQLVRPLLERGIEMITIPFGGQTLKVSITLASPSTMTDIEAASKQVEQDLEILATPALSDVEGPAAEPVQPDTAPAEASPPVPEEGTLPPTPAAPSELLPSPTTPPSGGS